MDSIYGKLLRCARLGELTAQEYEAASSEVAGRWTLPFIGSALLEEEFRSKLLNRGGRGLEDDRLLGLYSEALAEIAPANWLLARTGRAGRVSPRIATFVSPSAGQDFALTHGLFALQFAHLLKNLNGWKLVIHESSYLAYRDRSNQAVGVLEGAVLGVKSDYRLSADQLLELSLFKPTFPNALIGPAIAKLHNALLLKLPEGSEIAESVRLLGASRAFFNQRSAEARKDNLKLQQYLVLNLKAYDYPRVVRHSPVELRRSALDEAVVLIDSPMEHWKVNAIYEILVPLVMTKKTFFEGVFSALEVKSQRTEEISWERAKRFLHYAKEKMHERTTRR